LDKIKINLNEVMLSFNDQYKSKKTISVIFVLLLTAIQFIIPFACPLMAQDNQKAVPIKSLARLTEQEWKSVEGYFQNPGNSDLYVQFKTSHDTLIGKTLWNNNIFHLLPQTPLSFLSTEEGEAGHIHINFIKDSTGAVNSMSLGNNNIWKRANNYKPIVRKEMEHSPEQLKAYEGLYQFRNDSTRFLQFTEAGNALVLKQLWDGFKISFVPETIFDFFSRDVSMFTLTFSKDKDGQINQVTAFRKDVWIKTSKPTLTEADLKLYEGKYQSTDDPDNVVQITVRHNQLVLKQLWDKKEIELDPMASNYFYNDAQSFPLQILRGKNGSVNQIIILGMDKFDRLK
jgi:hypothetical protein